MSNSLFSSLGLLFFATWSIVVGSVTVAAFGRDRIPAVARTNDRKPGPNSVRPKRPAWRQL